MCIRDRDSELAQAIHYDLIVSGYIDRKGALTDKYYADKANGEIKVAEEVADSRDAVIDILDSVYDSRMMQPENARDKNVELQVDPEKLAMPEFKALWQRISPKSVYVVDFDTDELVQKAIDALNRNLRVSKVFCKAVSYTHLEVYKRQVELHYAIAPCEVFGHDPPQGDKPDPAGTRGREPTSDEHQRAQTAGKFGVFLPADDRPNQKAD